jgi:hypothetical protein
VAFLAFAAMCLTQNAFRIKGRFKFAAWLWLLWLLACFLAAAACRSVLLSIRSDSTWSAAWSVMDWQLLLWTLSSLPLALGLGLDLHEDLGWPRSRLWSLHGLALGPWLAGAFPWTQAASFLPPLALLGILSWRLAPESFSAYRPWAALAAFNLLGFLYGTALPPSWLAGPLMVLILSLFLCPFGRRAALGGILLGLLALQIRQRYFAQGIWPGWVAAALGISIGWASFHLLKREHASQA